VRKVSEYEDHADECRKMAVKASDPIHKQQLTAMAHAWAMLAGERRKQLAKRQNGLLDSIDHE
jgi:hypothetical protein